MLTPIYGDARTRQIAALHACIGHHNGDTTIHDGDSGVEWLTGWDSDRRADADDDRRWRQLP